MAWWSLVGMELHWGATPFQSTFEWGWSVSECIWATATTSDWLVGLQGCAELVLPKSFSEIPLQIDLKKECGFISICVARSCWRIGWELAAVEGRCVSQWVVGTCLRERPSDDSVLNDTTCVYARPLTGGMLGNTTAVFRGRLTFLANCFPFLKSVSFEASVKFTHRLHVHVRCIHVLCIMYEIYTSYTTWFKCQNYERSKRVW